MTLINGHIFFACNIMLLAKVTVQDPKHVYYFASPIDFLYFVSFRIFCRVVTSLAIVTCTLEQQYEILGNFRAQIKNLKHNTSEKINLDKTLLFKF